MTALARRLEKVERVAAARAAAYRDQRTERDEACQAVWDEVTADTEGVAALRRLCGGKVYEGGRRRAPNEHEIERACVALESRIDEISRRMGYAVRPVPPLSLSGLAKPRTDRELALHRFAGLSTPNLAIAARYVNAVQFRNDDDGEEEFQAAAALLRPRFEAFLEAEAGERERLEAEENVTEGDDDAD